MKIDFFQLILALTISFYMHSMDIIVKIIAPACEAAIDLTPSFLKEHEISSKGLYMIEKTKHKGGTIVQAITFEKLSNDTLVFLKERTRKSMIKKIISIVETSLNTCNYCYLHNHRYLYLIHVPFTKYHNNLIIVENTVKVTRYNLLSRKSIKFTYKRENPVEFILEERKIKDTSTLDDMYKCSKTGRPYPPCFVCGNTTIKPKRCSKCLLAYYCSGKCQKKDWKTHKSKCGKIKPYSKIGSLYHSCCVCGNTETEPERCSNCLVAYYCSRKCQKKDWKTHKTVCVRKTVCAQRVK